MSFFKKIQAKVGEAASQKIKARFGEAIELEIKIEKDDFLPGEIVKGTLTVTGGEVEQRIDLVHLQLFTQVRRKRKQEEYLRDACFFSCQLEGIPAFTIKSKEEKEFPFSFQLPEELPVSSDKTMVWFIAELLIKNINNPVAQEYILSKKEESMKRLHETLVEKEFELVDVVNEVLPGTPNGMVQLFEYRLPSPYGDFIKRMELFAVTKDGKHEVFLLFNRNKHLLLEEGTPIDLNLPQFMMYKRSEEKELFPIVEKAVLLEVERVKSLGLVKVDESLVKDQFEKEKDED